MKKINILLTVLILILTPGIMISQTYDLQFIEELNDGSNYNVRVQIKASSDFKLAASNITFNFNSAGLSSPTLLTPHNFNGPDPGPPFTVYGTMGVEEPLVGVASINIVYTYEEETYAATVGTEWVDVASVGFTTDNSSLTSNLNFRSASPSPTVVYSVSGSGVTYTITLLTAGTWLTLDNPLPVELSSFTADANGNKVDLSWETKTEVNNYGFNVERRINEGEWNSITFIEGHGTINSPKEYSYSDKDLYVGGSKFQYRLKQVDNDGSFEYSDVVEVEIAPSQYELSQNYPNPFNPSTTIKFSLPKQTQLKLNLYNMLGELVETIVEGNYEVGNYKVTFNASNLPSGVYVYRIESSDFVQTKKMMLLK